MIFLSKEFLDKYPDQPEHAIELSSFVFYRTYSRWLDSEGRRETFKEAIARAVEYSMNTGYNKFMNNKFLLSETQIKAMINEAEVLFDNIFNLRQFLSGRTHWVGGANTKVADKFPLSNFNCAFVNFTKWSDLNEIFYLLLVGSGVGVRFRKEDIRNLPNIRTDYELIHSEFKPVNKSERLQVTKINIMDNGYAKIYVADSKEGWVDALKLFMSIITKPEHSHIKHIKISYNSIRPKGERLKTFGGRASGHEPLQKMFTSFDLIFKNKFNEQVNQINDNLIQLRPIHLLDMVTLMGSNVVVGGVRRTAIMVICDEDDDEIIKAKESFWEDENKLHRAMSNNSIGYTKKPTKERIVQIIESIKNNGEPGVINLESASKRRPNAMGVNPLI